MFKSYGDFTEGVVFLLFVELHQEESAAAACIFGLIIYILKKIDGVGPVDKRPSTD